MTPLERLRFAERLAGVLAEAVRAGTLRAREFDALLVDPEFDEDEFERFRERVSAAGLALPEAGDDEPIPPAPREPGPGDRDALDRYLDEIGRIPLLAHEEMLR